MEKEQNPLQDYDQQSRQLAEEIARLEAANYSASPIIAHAQNIDVDLQPGITGIRQSKSHRQDIDALFLQIDNLRNIIRRNI